MSKKLVALFALLIIALINRNVLAEEATDPLPDWNDRDAKKAITDFVKKVTTEGSVDFVKPEDRIAVFDNDGTLWCEQPMYFQLAFAIDRVKATADQHPDWKAREPFSSILKGDMETVMSSEMKEMVEIIYATHAGITVDEFNAIVKDWMKTAQHPVYKRPYNQCIYQPMVELLDYLRANGFTTFIVSGGGVEFMRAWAEDAYGIPPHQIIGSSGRTEFRIRDGKAVLVKEPKMEFINDGEGKPVGINRFIGKRPIMAFGNSDGDLEMLQYTTMTDGPRFGAIIHHTDDAREVQYDRASDTGKLDKALDEAKTQKWTVIDMKSDWKTIFPAPASE